MLYEFRHLSELLIRNMTEKTRRTENAGFEQLRFLLVAKLRATCENTE